jgi:hypothetical protein
LKLVTADEMFFAIRTEAVKLKILIIIVFELEKKSLTWRRKL